MNLYALRDKRSGKWIESVQRSDDQRHWSIRVPVAFIDKDDAERYAAPLVDSTGQPAVEVVEVSEKGSE
jgi:hypothetical protein